MEDPEVITESGDNIFADIGMAGAEEHFLKAELVTKLAEVIRSRGLNQSRAAKLVGISQPDLSRVLRGRFRDVSVERLMRALTGLNADVEITVRDEGHKVGRSIHLHRAPALAD